MLDDIYLELGDAVRSYLDVEPYLQDTDQVRIRSGETVWVVFWSLHAYCRGVGFSQDDTGVWTIDPPLQAVMVSASARYSSQSMPPASQAPFTVTDWSATELAILSAYRLRAG